MTDLLGAVREAIARHQLLKPDDRVLVGLSGGPDSMVLLHALHRLGYSVVAAHLDHALRPDSFTEANWVAAHCGEWRIPCVVRRNAVKPSGSLEEAAREARYAFLNAMAAKQNCTAIALGHHADDQAETVLFRLARGTGPTGLGAMRARRGQQDGPPIIRPLLDFQRADLLKALADWELPSLQDPSNADQSFARNRIRHSVLPDLAAVSPDASRHVARLAGMMQEEEDLKEEETRRLAKYMVRTFSPGIGELDRPALLALPLPMRRRLLRHAAALLGAQAWDAASLERALAVVEFGGAADLAGGWRLSLEAGVLVLSGNLQGPSPVLFSRDDSEQPTTAWGWTVSVRRTLSSAPASSVLVRFDPAQLPSELNWRSARPDTDAFQPWGHRDKRSLRHFLSKAGIPRHRQESLLVLADGEEVLWVVGVRRGSQAALEQTPEEVWEMQAAAGFQV